MVSARVCLKQKLRRVHLKQDYVEDNLSENDHMPQVQASSDQRKLKKKSSVKLVNLMTLKFSESDIFVIL